MDRNIIIIMLLALLATACNPCKRALKRGCYTADTTTITMHDTIHTETVRADTMFIDLPGDTVTLVKDRLRMQYVRYGDTVYLTGECLGDTIYLTRTVKVPTLQVTPPLTRWQIAANRAKRMFMYIGMATLLAGLWWLGLRLYLNRHQKED